MILYELTGGDESHQLYQALEVANVNRQYDFLRTVTLVSLAANCHFLSGHIIKALNFHAITCLHTNAGEYRPCPVVVGDYRPPDHYRVDALMEDFVNRVNRIWSSSDPIALAAFVVWRLNHIHPFVNGNGRTARAACYFVLCLALGEWLPGKAILPELLSRNRDEYVAALKHADASLTAGKLDLSVLHALILRLLLEQVRPTTEHTPPALPAPS